MRKKFLALLILILSTLANSAAAEPFSADVHPKLVKLNGAMSTKVAITGTLPHPMALRAVVSGPIKDYRLVAKKKYYGIWVSTQPQIVPGIPSYYQAFGSKQPESLIQTDAMKMISNKLMERGLYITDVSPINYKDGKFYSLELILPPNARDGVYKVDIHGSSVSKTLYFTVEILSNTQYIKDLAKQHPQLYTTITILLAIIAGFIAGKLKNGARQH